MACDEAAAGGDERARAAESLAAWWREAGVDLLAPEAARGAMARGPAAAEPPPDAARAPRSAADTPRGRAPGPTTSGPTTPGPTTSGPTTSGLTATRPPRRAFTDTITSRKAAGAGAGERRGPDAKAVIADVDPGAAAAPEAAALADVARARAAAAASLEALRATLESFDDHPLHAAARTTVFARGVAAAPVMIVGEAPGREEDAQGLPFVGRSGKLLDAMFATIGLSAAPTGSERGLYITNIVNWRPPGNRNPSADEIALCEPFIARHIALARPAILVLAGGVAAQTLLDTRQGIMRLRGRWASYTPPGGAAIPTLPMHHPAFILRRPIAKRDAWADLLALEARLAELD